MPTHATSSTHQLIHHTRTHYSHHCSASFSLSSFSSFVAIFLVIHGSHSHSTHPSNDTITHTMNGWTMVKCGLCVIAITISICFFLLFLLLDSLLRSHRYDRRFIFERRSNVCDVRNTSIYCYLSLFFFIAFHQKNVVHFTGAHDINHQYT